MSHVWRWTIAIAMVGLASCGEGEDTEPTPLLYTFSFVADTQPFRPYSLWLEDFKEGVTSQIAIAVLADFEPDCPIDRIQGTITYDPAVLQTENHSEGSFMDQGGIDAQTFVTFRRGEITFRVDRPGSQGAFGRGHVLTIRFRAASTSARGETSPLEWTDAQAFSPDFLECLHATRSGEISVR
jgi:hypothetical protein